jgi:phosphatidylglycerophosphate synthase
VTTIVSRRIALANPYRRLTPNIVTTIGLCLGILCGVSLALGSTALALLTGFSSVFCDLLDGTIARKFGMETTFGLVFDSIADRGSELAMVAGALHAGIIHPLGVMAIIGSTALLLSRTISYLNRQDTNNVLFGRAERIIFISLGLAAPSVFMSTSCFVISGGLGLVSSCQIGRLLWRKHFHENSEVANKEATR